MGLTTANEQMALALAALQAGVWVEYNQVQDAWFFDIPHSVLTAWGKTPLDALAEAAVVLGLQPIYCPPPPKHADAVAIIDRWLKAMDNPETEPPLEVHHTDLDVLRAAIAFPPPPAVERDPGRMGGKPVLRGTRLPVSTILTFLADCGSIEAAAAELEITPDEVRSVVQYAACPPPQQGEMVPLESVARLLWSQSPMSRTCPWAEVHPDVKQELIGRTRAALREEAPNNV